MDTIKMHISHVKCIDDLTFEIPVEKGLYAITGKNGFPTGCRKTA